MENKPPSKVVTILVGGGIDEGDVFTVAGRAGSIGEARKLCLNPAFIKEYLVSRKEGAYILLVSHSGHHVFLPIRSVLEQDSVPTE
jgi:hypothetical protein